MVERILILTDSSNTINQELAKKNEIEILPLSLQRNDGKIYDDIISQITSLDILKMLDEGYSFKTSTTPLGVMEEIIKTKLTEYEKIIICPISRGFSSQYSHLVSISKKYPDRVFVIDTKDFGYSLECLCLELRKMINEKHTIEELIKFGNNYWTHTLSLFACKKLDGLAKSGRLPKILAKTLSLTKITPIIKAEYENKREGFAFGWANVFEKFIKYSNKIFDNKLDKNNIVNICVLTSEENSDDIQKMVDLISKEYGIKKENISLRWAPSVFLCFVWKEAIGITIISNLKKEKFLK